MTWTDPPDEIVQARDRLLESASLLALGLSSGSFHYPRAGITDTLPLCVLDLEDGTTTRQTNSGTFEDGTVNAVMVLDANTVTAGALEKASRTIAGEVTALTTDGLFIRSIKRGRAGVPSAGLWAGSDTGAPESCHAMVSILLRIEWGDE